jgi:hypothetical protein
MGIILWKVNISDNLVNISAHVHKSLCMACCPSQGPHVRDRQMGAGKTKCTATGTSSDPGLFSLCLWARNFFLASIRTNFPLEP